ncbi:MAG TPA: MBL fold metallo-hydrolase [Chiayiivirga sp.]|jgi:flavorubredoxin|uniref:MBL fold metallo-hydrolase n=1 Tax=Denitratimonas tolerans TaxID=1338420 RepID=A0AAW9R5Z2_9GAMM|nr:MBL fold metallo-hydrolase [Xanthomonadaceae bacterium]MDX9763949.1 MBL fold metallo-hydrolase [Chiayiivirga sp.]MEB2315190.1 MBL fold metallo-hydrolase [Xanthomonadaceae bacterium]HMN35386.1 MBL fold metallo-hydrolase [Chiayiivirga sp.]HRN59946.1 MBL fold metallo-hydrolase [Chiayiivirga sp.]
MAHVLFESGDHRCMVFNDLVRSDDGIQANQFLITRGRTSALLDPGGGLLYTPLSLAVARHVPLKDLTWILASHQDPDIIGAADRWLMYTSAVLVCSRLWGRFVPHTVPSYQQNAHADRYMLLPDEGGRIPMGDSHLLALPAHFLHSVGNFSFYDPVSRILFSGDVGSSMISSGEEYRAVEDLSSVLPRMEGFHRRYMVSRRVARLWSAMVRSIDPVLIVPQHGLPLRGKAIGDFLDWLSGLECGIDLMGPEHYRVPY